MSRKLLRGFRRRRAARQKLGAVPGSMERETGSSHSARMADASSMSFQDKRRVERR
jgi:hypothetical protein